MLLEISKPERILEEQNILSTNIVFGGANHSDEASIDNKIVIADNSVKKDPTSTYLTREKIRLKNLKSISHY
tara:strand:- start:435 stop:650 length:216 start_codon:yes stop_codon:yes gene_type:complete